jgi:hypothetical protein
MLKSKWCLWLIERTVNIGIDKAYADLKAVLLEKGCKIISEEPQKQILVKQGSIWGMSPRTAKKIVEVNFAPVDSGTQVTCSSRLSSDWKNLTVVGCALAAVLVGLCLWITFDLDGFLVTQKPSFWSWLVTINGSVDFQVGQAFVNLTRALAVFLSVIIVLEIVIVVYVHTGIDRFAKGTFNSLLSREPTGSALKQ